MLVICYLPIFAIINPNTHYLLLLPTTQVLFFFFYFIPIFPHTLLILIISVALGYDSIIVLTRSYPAIAFYWRRVS